ncbi:MAG: beta-galactosidase, partial [Anaerolineales bacterium]
MKVLQEQNMKNDRLNKNLPQFPYGAVYYRKSNPPEADWDRDTAQAAREGMNIFRHWFLWGNIEVRPGEFYWDDYDRHMDLAQKYGIKVIIAEHITSVPMWLFRRRPDLFARRSRGEILTAGISGSCASGNFANLCLDNAEGRELAGNFLSELVKRYRGHAALLGYDVANEGSISQLAVFHPDTFKAYRTWLKARYGSLDALNSAWRRYSMADWEDVEPTDTPDAPLPEALDLWRFRREHTYAQVKWRIDLIRELDPDSLVVSHGTTWTPQVTDHWMFAKDVDVYGFTYVACRHTNAPWKAWFYTDLTRAAARGKPFWHAEAQGGPLWLQPQGPGRRPEDGRVATGANVRIWNLISMAGGTRGMLFTRWRGLLDPPLWDAFGLHNLDGSANERSEMAAVLAKWSNHPEQADLMQAAPARGEMALLYLPEAMFYDQALTHHLQAKGSVITTLEGAYRGLYDQNIQLDLVELENIDAYKVIY